MADTRGVIGVRGRVVVDLRTGEKREKRDDEVVARELGVEYESSFRYERSQQMHGIVMTTMGGDEVNARRLQRLLGYGITGEMAEKVFAVWVGSGNNGRGLLLHVLRDLLGQYCETMSCSLLTTRSILSRPQLLGKRLAIVHRLLGKRKKLNTESMLELTEGRPVVARQMYKKPFDFEPRHMIVLEIDEMPLMDAEVAERCVTIQFPVKFKNLQPGEEETTTLKQRDIMLEERLRSPEWKAAMFAWLVEGAMAWYQSLPEGGF